jgi:hypothetical protein
MIPIAKPANACRLLIAISILGISFLPVPRSSAQATPSSVNKAIGTIKGITGAAIVLAPDTGPEMTIEVQPATKFLRVAPGEKTLKNATPIQAKDLQVGDRILVAGKPSGDNSSLIASTVVVMTKTDLQAEHQREMDDWQKRGVESVGTMSLCYSDCVWSSQSMDLASSFGACMDPPVTSRSAVINVSSSQGLPLFISHERWKSVATLRLVPAAMNC